MKKLWFILAWVTLSTSTLLANAAAFRYLTTRPQPTIKVIGSSTVLSATPQQPAGDVKGVSTTVDIGDARVPIVANFLRRHSAPLDADSFAKTIVTIADKYGVDFRLLPAISMQESNLCKSIPPGTYNCLGFGINEHQTMGFDSYEANFDRAARILKQNYINQGLTTPEQIMHKYTPKSDGSWASSVNQWMSEMRYDDHDKGLDLKKNANVLEYTTPTSPSPSPQ